MISSHDPPKTAKQKAYAFYGPPFGYYTVGLL